MWVFTYKLDKHGNLTKCKARLVVCGNQQDPGDLPTRATTLASTTFRTLMAVTAQFDLETRQLDAVNAFVNCELDEVVYMRLPPGFGKPGKVLLLQKALYGLRRSPWLWQHRLTDVFRSLGFTPLAQEPCVALKDGVLVFYYVDDIVFIYRKEHLAQAEAAITGLKRQFEMTDCGELKWFLGIHVVRNRQKRLLWLSQAAYIEKVANESGIDLSTRPPETPMAETELLPTPTDYPQASPASVTQYQGKVGSILYAAITTRPDVAFAASRLARFNSNPSQIHQEAADRAIRYLYHTRDRSICYGVGNKALVCASDASFGDNTMDRKSSQGYIMMLFGGAIAWRANKQDTVTTSSTEAELLALSQAAKEALFMGRLFKALSLELNEPLVIQCDNRQTIRLVVEESAKLDTKLRHVDIHNHWLRQEYSSGRVLVEWVETARMPADGLTKALGKGKYQGFIRQIGLQGIKDQLESVRRMEELRDRIRNPQHHDDVICIKTGGRQMRRH